MSQSSAAFLEDVLAWDSSTCRARLQEALPRLLIYLKESLKLEEEIGILRIICNSFLPEVTLEDVEEKVFSKFAQSACPMTERLDLALRETLSCCSSDQTAIQGEVTALLELWMGLLDCAELCVAYVLAVASSVHLHLVHSLPSAVLHLLAGTYTHCKDSGAVYGSVMGVVGEHLSSLCNKAYKLQMAFLNMFDKIVIEEDAREKDIDNICSVCEGCFRLCPVVSRLGLKQLASLWKAISRLATEYAFVLRGRLHVEEMVTHLCREVTEGMTYLVELDQQSDSQELLLSSGDRTFSKWVRLVAFQLKVLAALVKEYGAVLDAGLDTVYSLLLFLYAQLPVCRGGLLSIRSQELQRHLLVVTPPLVFHLLVLPRLQPLLTSTPSERSGVERSPVPRLLVQMNVLEHLHRTPDEVQAEWLAPKTDAGESGTLSIMDAVFYQADLCFVEMALPLSLPADMNAGREESLYEAVCHRLCAVLTIWPAGLLHTLERSLLRAVVSGGAVASLLAADCWSYLARQSSTATRMQHVEMLLLLIEDLPDHSGLASSSSPLLSLARRLIAFLSQEQQHQLVEKFCGQRFWELWAGLGLASLQAVPARVVADGLLVTASSLLTPPSLHQPPQPSSLMQKHLVQAAGCISAVGRHLPAGGWPDWLVAMVTALWEEAAAAMREEGRGEDWGGILPVLMQMSVPLLRTLTPKTWLNMLEVVKWWLGTEEGKASTLAGLMAAEVAGSFASIRVPPSVLQRGVLMALAAVFRRVLSSRHCLVHHTALAAFADFAQKTMHEDVVPQCLHNCLALEDCFTQFLQKEPASRMDTQQRLDYLQQLLQQRTALERDKVELSPLPPGPQEDSQPAAKRLRLEAGEGEMADEALDWSHAGEELQRAVNRVCALLRKPRPPPCLVLETQAAIRDLQASLPSPP